MRYSPTQINMYLRCPAQYFFRYRQGIKLPPKVSLVKGRAVHKGIATNYTQKVESRIDLPVDDVLDATSAEYEKAIADVEDMEGKDKGKEKDNCIVLTKLYHKVYSPNIQPVAVEKRILVESDNCEIEGYIDVVDEQGTIRDTKTKGRLPDKGDIDKDIQLTAYSMMYRALVGEPETSLSMDCLISSKNPYCQSIVTQRTDKDIKRFMTLLDRVRVAIEADMFYPVDSPGWECTPEYCGYYNLCHKTF